MKSEIAELHYELNILAGGLRGLGISMSIHGNVPEADITEHHMAQIGHLVEAAGRYAERLGAELDACNG